MAGLDQVKHPMRFAVAASTTSGLLVVLLTAAAGRVSRSWPAWHVLLPPLFGLGWALAALPLVLRVRRRAAGTRRVFLIVAAFTHKHWVSQLIRDLHENLERRGYEMVLKIPDRDYSGESQARLLDRILERRHEYAGGGPFRATVVQDSYKVAEAAAGLLERMLRNEPVPRRTSVPVEILAHD